MNSENQYFEYKKIKSKVNVLKIKVKNNNYVK